VAITPEQMARSGSEDGEQLALFQWIALHSSTYPELKWLHHSPNGGSRNKREGAKFKAMGVKRGFPDLTLPLPCRQYAGLYIDLKKVKGGVTSKEQEDWLAYLNSAGYYATVCKGWLQAVSCLEWYLKLER
jgi:hypothetical protein